MTSLLRVSLRGKQAERYRPREEPVLIRPAGGALSADLMERLAARFREEHAGLFQASLAQPGIDEEFRRAATDVALHWSDPPLAPTQREEAVARMVGRFLGYGPLDPLLADPSVTEVMVNRRDDVWVERAGRLSRADAAFPSEADVFRTAQRMSRRFGRELNRDHPTVDARLPDGSRIFAVTEPLKVHGTALNIRRFPPKPYSGQNLVDFGMFSREMLEFFRLLFRGHATVLVAGATGTGKTTLVQVVALESGVNERLVTIEDTDELRLDQFFPNVVALQAQRRDEDEDDGGLVMSVLVTKALRMRPDRIIPGELRGAEVTAFIDAVWSGHMGAWTTVHTRGGRLGALERVADLIVRSEPGQTYQSALERARKTFDVIIQVERLVDGVRRVNEVVEVLPDGFQPVYQRNHGRFEQVGRPSPRLAAFLDRHGGEVDARWKPS